MSKLEIFTKPGIAGKLLLWFLAVALLPLLFVGYVSVDVSTRALRDEVTNNLVTVADAKARRIGTYVVEKRRNATTLARNPTVIRAIERLVPVFVQGGIDGPEYVALDRDFRPFLRYHQEENGYYDLLLVSPVGDVVFSVAKEDDLATNLVTGPYKHSELAKSFDRAQTLLDTGVSDFRDYPPSRQPAAFIAAPVYARERLIGVVVLQVDAEEIYALADDYTGLGKTGETVIASREGDDAVFVAPVRHDREAAFQRKVPIGAPEGLAIQAAVQGKRAAGISLDYRGVETLAVSRYLSHGRWGMVAKIDADEAFAPIRALRMASWTIAAVTLLAVAVLAVLVSRSISKPIRALHQGTEIIGSGDLNHRVGTDAQDEIGQLSRAFDRMVENLRRDEAQLRQIIDLVPHRIFAKDREGRFVLANRTVAETYGTTVEELVGRTDADFHPPGQELDSFLKNDLEVIESGQPKFIPEEILISATGDRCILQTVKIPFTTSGTSEPAVLGVAIDITQLKQAQDALQQAHDELEIRVEERTAELARSNADLLQFAQIASHDLQEPLRAVGGFVQLLQRRYQGKLDAKADEYIGFAVDGARRMQQLINDLLAYSRVGTRGKAFESVDLNEALDAATVNLKASIDEHAARVICQQLPTLVADRTQLVQLFQNLIGNAIKFQGDEPPEVQISARQADGEWLLSVSDNGIGIDAKYADRIFVIFQRLHNRTEYPGTGIGLAICKRIVERHGGRIWLESEPGKGAAFHFTISSRNPEHERSSE